MTKQRRVILVTDGDDVAIKALESVAKQIGGRCITASGGNPTPITGEEIVKMILSTPYDPVLVMFDDNGNSGTGSGEQALKYVVEHPEIIVLGVLAVASNTLFVEGVEVDYSISNKGKITHYQVDKYGNIIKNSTPKVNGDTVDILRKLDKIPIIIGIGDIGKMNGKDHLRYGAPITRKAIEFILERSEQISE
jgi:stage V sporulation protein AE